MSEQSIDERRLAHEPSDDFVQSTNVHAFMQTHGIDTYDELLERTTTAIPGVENSGVDWFWDQLVETLDIEFYEDYDDVRDDTNGPQFSEWYPGGQLNIAHNTVDRFATRDSPHRNQIACIWEAESG